MHPTGIGVAHRWRGGRVRGDAEWVLEHLFSPRAFSCAFLSLPSPPGRGVPLPQPLTILDFTSAFLQPTLPQPPPPEGAQLRTSGLFLTHLHQSHWWGATAVDAGLRGSVGLCKFFLLSQSLFVLLQPCCLHHAILSSLPLSSAPSPWDVGRPRG